MAISLLYTAALSFSWSCEDDMKLVDDFSIRMSAEDLSGCQELCRSRVCKTLSFSENECVLSHRSGSDTVRTEGCVTCGFVEVDTEGQERGYDLLEVVPSDGPPPTPAPVTDPPVPPSSGVDPNGIRYCDKDADCRFNGDAEATCDTATGRCDCGDGYENKVIKKKKQYSCRPINEVTPPPKVFCIVKLVFPLGDCNEFKARGLWQALINILIARFTNARSSTNSTGCGSVHFNAELEVEQDDVTDVLPTINADVQQEIQKDTTLSNVVGSELTTSAEVVPLGAGTPCVITGSTKTTQFDINGQQVCSALQCADGYQLVDGSSGITECVVATINAPTVLRSTDSDDDETNTIIIIVSVIGFVLLLILLGLCIYFFRREASGGNYSSRSRQDAASSEVSYNYSDSYNDIVV